MSRRRPHAAHCVLRHKSGRNLRRPRKPGRRWRTARRSSGDREQRPSPGPRAISLANSGPSSFRIASLPAATSLTSTGRLSLKRLPTDHNRRNAGRPLAWIGDSLDDELTVDPPVEHHAFWHCPAARPGSWRGRRTLRGSRPNWTCKASWTKRLRALSRRKENCRSGSRRQCLCGLMVGRIAQQWRPTAALPVLAFSVLAFSYRRCPLSARRRPAATLPVPPNAPRCPPRFVVFTRTVPRKHSARFVSPATTECQAAGLEFLTRYLLPGFFSARKRQDLLLVRPDERLQLEMRQVLWSNAGAARMLRMSARRLRSIADGVGPADAVTSISVPDRLASSRKRRRDASG